MQKYLSFLFQAHNYPIKNFLFLFSKSSHKFSSCDQGVNEDEKSSEFVDRDDRVFFRQVTLV
jgi:hypothetical protein